MLKHFAFKKFIIISISFVILLILYLFPKDNSYNIKTTTTYTNPETIPIYLINNDNLVSRFEVIKTTNNNTLELVDEIIKKLTNNNEKESYIPSEFKKIIPKNTKVLEKSLTDGLLKINFSKELLDVDAKLEEKLIESLIYSLTEIKDVDKIMIFVEGEKLTKLPNSHKNLPNTLDRSYGINKIYELDSMKDISKITTYYVSKQESFYYYIPITTIDNNKKEKIEVIVEKLKSSPTYQTNLVSYLTASVNLQKYEILENSINLSFNNDIINLDKNNILEEVKYSIALSVRDTYNIHQTIFYIDDILFDTAFV